MEKPSFNLLSERGGESIVSLSFSPGFVFTNLNTLRKSRNLWILISPRKKNISIRIKKFLFIFLIKLIFKGNLKVKFLTKEEYLKYEYCSNISYSQNLRNNLDEFKENEAFKLLISIIGKSPAKKYALFNLTPFYTRKVLYKSVLADLHSNEFIISHPFSQKNPEKSLQSLVLILWKISKSFYNYIKKLFYFLYIILIPVFFIFKTLKNGITAHPVKKNYDIALPVVIGIGEKSSFLKEGILRSYDDTHLVQGLLKNKKIVFIFGRWPFKAELKNTFKKNLKKRGIEYLDLDLLKLPINLLKLVFKLQIQIFKLMPSFFTKLQIRDIDIEIYKVIPKALYHYLRKNLENHFLETVFEIVKDDYNSAHIVNTAVANKYGCKTLGLQHTSYPSSSPYLNFVFFNKYGTFSPKTELDFAKGWKQLSTKYVGKDTLDVTLRMNSNKLRDQIRKKFQEIYGTHQKIVLVLIPGDIGYFPKSRWDELMKGLELWGNKSKNEQGLILRFRSKIDVDKSQILKRIETLSERYDNFIVDYEVFATEELMSISDLIIAPHSSYAINEASALKKNVFSFDISLSASFDFNDYGEDFLLESAEDFIKALSLLDKSQNGGTKTIRVDWEKLHKDTIGNIESSLDNIHKLMLSMLH